MSASVVRAHDAEARGKEEESKTPSGAEVCEL